MPNLPSAFKRMKTSAVNRLKNRSVKSRIATIVANLQKAVDAGDKAKCKEIFKEYCSAMDKAVKLGVIMQNTADRSKSRASKRMAGAAAPKAV